MSRLDRDGPATASDLAAAERVRHQPMVATIAEAVAVLGRLTQP